MSARPFSLPAHAPDRRPARTRRTGRVLAAAAVAAAVVLGSAAVAEAHVTVKPESTTGGGYTQLVFRVPNESDTASTVKLSVILPTDHPLMSARTAPVPGWKAVVTRGRFATPLTVDGGQVTEGPVRITWTADKGAAIEEGEYQNFPISVGPLPKSGTMTFAAEQTYSDGRVVSWNEKAGADGAEPDLPAPAFEVTAASAPAGSASSPTATAATAPADASDPWARAMAGAALLVALLGAGLAFVRGRRPATGTA